MQLDELVPTPSSDRVNEIVKKIFGYNLKLENLTVRKAQQLQENFSKQLQVYENKLGSRCSNNPTYLQLKMVNEVLDKHIAEAREPHAVGMAQAMKSTGDEPPLKKSTIRKAHEIARAIKRDESVTESVILEGEMEAAEQVMAAKNIVDRIQGMLEDLGEILNEDIPPLTDSIRDAMDSNTADQFNSAMTQTVEAALDAMRTARQGADSAARVLTGDAPTMGAEPAADDAGLGLDDMEMEPTTDQDTEQEDEFGAADAAAGGEEAALGREKRA